MTAQTTTTDAKVRGFAIKCNRGYVAYQGRMTWLQDKPIGWALFSSEKHAREIGDWNRTANGTGYSVETIY